MAKTTPADPTIDQTDAAPAVDETVAAVEEAPGLKLGTNAFLTAVHGLIIHPFTGQAFDVSTPTKTEVDAWAVIQFDAGKLVKA